MMTNNTYSIAAIREWIDTRKSEMILRFIETLSL